ncbi:hypothetical protein ACFYVR_13530 [Rhodococcus sp. NPDC003318]|uniref:hypothetical protein n=1 Tax=Rhodococcus sp. NPDC003318 TaxID=3364503 RepID=UPI0036A18C71
MATVQRLGDEHGNPDIEAAPGLLVHHEVIVETEAGEGDIPYAATVKIRPRNGVYVVAELTVRQGEDGPPIQRGELAKFTLENSLRIAADSARRVTPNGLVDPHVRDEFFDRIKSDGLADDDLPELAYAYRWIRLQEGRPTTLLADEFGVTTATVKRWLGKAVAAGHLTQDERAKAR